MADLTGLDISLCRFDATAHTAYQASLLSSLQSGAFISPHVHAKYDLNKTPECSACGEPDNHWHWPICPKYQQYSEGWEGDIPDWPCSLLAHLLPSRNPWTYSLKHHLSATIDQTYHYHSAPGHGPQHLFTDGSQCGHVNPWLQLSAFAVLNASTGLPISADRLAVSLAFYKGQTERRYVGYSPLFNGHTDFLFQCTCGWTTSLWQTPPSFSSRPERYQAAGVMKICGHRC